jgi:hypothetical protein
MRRLAVWICAACGEPEADCIVDLDDERWQGPKGACACGCDDWDGPMRLDDALGAWCGGLDADL